MHMPLPPTVIINEFQGPQIRLLHAVRQVLPRVLQRGDDRAGEMETATLIFAIFRIYMINHSTFLSTVSLPATSSSLTRRQMQVSKPPLRFVFLWISASTANFRFNL
jgi:hypothetical protein